VHPETRERSLVLGGFARTVAGFPPQASRDLIRILQDYVTRPEQTVRWSWRYHAHKRESFEERTAAPGNAHVTTIRLTTPAATRRWLATLR